MAKCPRCRNGDRLVPYFDEVEGVNGWRCVKCRYAEIP